MVETAWGVPEIEVISSARRFIGNESSAVLATVVDVQGSAYRRPGAKMVINEDGGSVGSITADCLEDEVKALARDVLADGTPRIKAYDLSSDGDVWGLGVGCNGIIDVLLEPLESHYSTVTDTVAAGKPIAVCTVTESDIQDLPTGERSYYLPNSSWVLSGNEWPETVFQELRDTAERRAQDGQALSVNIETPIGDCELFVDGIAPAPELVILGTGHDIRPVVELGKRNGFRVSVIGFRGATATSDRFPNADEVRSTSPRTLREEHTFDSDTYVVLMTHNFVDDRLALDALLDTQVPYIGLLGPQKRFEEMLTAFDEEDRTFGDAELDRIFTPAGLNLGSETPYQIALSIVAEILAVDNDRTPQHLKEQNGPIHKRIEPEKGHQNG
jgi:xanthine dehydrogenase accessory factor